MRSVLKAAIRVLIAFLVVQVLLAIDRSIGQLPLYSRMYDDSQQLIIAMAASFALQLLELAVLVLLWVKSDWVVKVIARDMDDSAIVIEGPQEQIAGWALRLLGVYLLVSSIPDVAGLVVYGIQMHAYLGTNPDALARNLSDWATRLTAIIIGVLLAWGVIRYDTIDRRNASRVARIVWNAGTHPEEETPKGPES